MVAINSPAADAQAPTTMSDPVKARGMPDAVPGSVWARIVCLSQWSTDFTEAGITAVDSAIQAYARDYAAAQVAEERERCAQYLRDAAARLAPEGKRIGQVDRHTAHVLACKGDEIAEGAAIRATTQEGKQP